MPEPTTLTVGTIAALAFTKFLETTASESSKKLTAAILGKMDELRNTIWNRLKGIPEVDELNSVAEKNGQVTDQQIKLLTPYLEAAMKEDKEFAQSIRQLAFEINQEINIGEIFAKNVQNIYGGSPVQINDPKSPVFTGDISGGTFNISITNH